MPPSPNQNAFFAALQQRSRLPDVATTWRWVGRDEAGLAIIRSDNGTIARARIAGNAAIGDGDVVLYIPPQPGQGLGQVQLATALPVPFIERREEPVFAGLPVKGVLQSTSNGVVEYFIGCDRPVPLPFFTLPEAEASTATVVIRATGIGLDDWLVTIRTQEFGQPQTLYLINPSGNTTIKAPDVNTFFQCFGSWAIQFKISGSIVITPSPDDFGSSTLDLTAYSTVTRSETATASVTSSWFRSAGAITANYEDLVWLSPSNFQITSSGPIPLAFNIQIVSSRTVGMHWNPTNNTRYGSPPFLQRIAPFAVPNRQGSLFNGEEYSLFFDDLALEQPTANVAKNSFYSFSFPFSTGQEIETISILETIFEEGAITTKNIDAEFFGFDPSIFGSSAVAATYFPPN